MTQYRVIGGGPHDGHKDDLARGVTKIVLPATALSQSDHNTPQFEVPIELDEKGKATADWRKRRAL